MEGAGVGEQGRGNNDVVRTLFHMAEIRAGAGNGVAWPMGRTPAHLRRRADTAEELGVIAGDCGAVRQRLGELRGFREISLHKPLDLADSC